MPYQLHDVSFVLSLISQNTIRVDLFIHATPNNSTSVYNVVSIESVQRGTWTIPTRIFNSGPRGSHTYQYYSSVSI